MHGNDSDPVYIQATTMTLAGIVFAQIGQVMNCRTERTSVFKVGLFSNRRIVAGIVFFHEPVSFLRLFFITTLIASIIGLKLVSH